MSEDKELCNCNEEESCSCGDGGCEGCCDCGGDDDIITLTLEDGTEMECAIIAIFPVEENEYIALLPLDKQDDGEVLLYRYEESEDGQFELLSIEADDEYEAVTAAFDEMLDDAEIEELFDDGEEE